MLSQNCSLQPLMITFSQSTFLLFLITCLPLFIGAFSSQLPLLRLPMPGFPPWEPTGNYIIYIKEKVQVVSNLIKILSPSTKINLLRFSPISLLANSSFISASVLSVISHFTLSEFMLFYQWYYLHFSHSVGSLPLGFMCIKVPTIFQQGNNQARSEIYIVSHPSLLKANLFIEVFVLLKFFSPLFSQSTPVQ